MNIVPANPLAEKIDKQQEERKAPAEYRYIGSARRVKGHELFSYNTKTGELKRAGLKREVQLTLPGKLPVVRTRATMEPDCICVQALNLANAKKRIRKMGFRKFMDEEAPQILQ